MVPTNPATVKVWSNEALQKWRHVRNRSRLLRPQQAVHVSSSQELNWGLLSEQ